jgi:methionyl-tRNA synthetase
MIRIVSYYCHPIHGLTTIYAIFQHLQHLYKNIILREMLNKFGTTQIYHFIGKDIVYHCYLFLPAICIALNYEYKLPNFIPTRGCLTLHNRRISESKLLYWIKRISCEIRSRLFKVLSCLNYTLFTNRYEF